MEANNLKPRGGSLTELRKLLDRAHKGYEDDLGNLTEAAGEDITELLAHDPQDVKELVAEYVRDASQLSEDYYDTVRQLWQQAAGADFPDFEHAGLTDPDLALWKTNGGFNNTGSPGLTYRQVKEGRSRAGFTMDDLWPDLSNPDDAMQFIADMIETSARLTMQSNIRLDPTKPRWARVPRGSSPCAFCVMLAGRGFAYRSEQTATFGGSFHNGHCHCQVVPSWGADRALTRAQMQWRDMYRHGVAEAGGTSPGKVTQAMRALYPEGVRDGHYTMSKPWPDEVIQPYRQVWEHILGNHGPGTDVPGKTAFPSSWSEKRVRYEVMETVASPDLVKSMKDGNREERYRLVDEEIIRVWLQKKRNTHGRFMINTAFPTMGKEKERAWRLIKKQHRPSAG